MHMEHLFGSITPQESFIVCHTQLKNIFAIFFSYIGIATVACQISDAMWDRESEHVMRSIICDLFFFPLFLAFFRLSFSNRYYIKSIICWLVCWLLHQSISAYRLCVKVIYWRFRCYCYCWFLVLMLFVNIDIMAKRSQSVCYQLLWPFHYHHSQHAHRPCCLCV